MRMDVLNMLEGSQRTIVFPEVGAAQKVEGEEGVGDQSTPHMEGKHGVNAG